MALVAIFLAIANRQSITLRLDPFIGVDAFWQVSMPLYLLIFLSILVGMVIGGFVSWRRAASARSQARAYRRQVRQQRTRPSEGSQLPVEAQS